MPHAWIALARANQGFVLPHISKASESAWPSCCRGLCQAGIQHSNGSHSKGSCKAEAAAGEGPGPGQQRCCRRRSCMQWQRLQPGCLRKRARGRCSGSRPAAPGRQRVLCRHGRRPGAETGARAIKWPQDCQPQTPQQAVTQDANMSAALLAAHMLHYSLQIRGCSQRPDWCH